MCWAKQTRDLHKVDKIIFQSYVEKVKYFFRIKSHLKWIFKHTSSHRSYKPRPFNSIIQNHERDKKYFERKFKVSPKCRKKKKKKRKKKSVKKTLKKPKKKVKNGRKGKRRKQKSLLKCLTRKGRICRTILLSKRRQKRPRVGWDTEMLCYIMFQK